MPASPSSLIASLSAAPAALCPPEVAAGLPAALAAADQHTGIVLASTDVDTKTNEITRFAALLDHLDDLRGVVVTSDALHCQHDHTTHLAQRGAHWILTVKGNQPSLHQTVGWPALAARATVDRDTARGHGRREIRTLKIMSVSTGIDFPHAAQAMQIRRRRRRLDEPKRFTTETVYAITDLLAHQAKPMQLADWIRGHWSIENKVNWVRDVTYDEDRSQVRTGTGPQVYGRHPQRRHRSPSESPASPTSPPPTATTPATPTDPWQQSASSNDFAEALGTEGPVRGLAAVARAGPSLAPRPRSSPRPCVRFCPIFIVDQRRHHEFMAAADGSYEVEEIDSPIQRVVARKKIFVVVPVVGAVVAFVLLAWEAVRRNLPPDTAKHWPWRLELLDYQSSATILTVLIVVVFTRMQYAETVRPAMSWTLLLTTDANLPIARDSDALLIVNVFNGGNGGAMFDAIQYRTALTTQREPTPWLSHGELYSALEKHGLQRNRDFYFAFLRAGLPLKPGESLLDKGLIIALFKRDVLKKFRILDIRLRVRDQVGDVHERVLPCRAVFTVALEAETDDARPPVRGVRHSLSDVLIKLLRQAR